ncbi:MAG TPA: 4Fe-4S binding protein [Nitrospirota bacterium]|nr:4Fe-4S binding protein [Nitrospirota bacterium]
MAEQRIALTFQRWQLDQPITYRLVKDFDLVTNILQAKVTAEEGKMSLVLTGLEQNIEDGIKWLKEQQVIVEPLATGLRVGKDSCVDCGACTGVCPTGALECDSEWTLVYDEEKCILCLACVPACPVRAIETA